MPSERGDVLHSWCVQAEWDAPEVVGGAGAWLRLAGGRSILYRATRGDLIIIAPPLVIAEADLAWALDLLDRLLAQLFPTPIASPTP